MPASAIPASPAIVRHILPTTVFRTLADLGMALPPFDDQVVYLEMSEEQQRDYRSVYDTCWRALLTYWPRSSVSDVKRQRNVCQVPKCGV
jgi:hypothetical protein